MDNNDFDLDFDFEKEYGIDPNRFLSDDDDFDYDRFLNEELPDEELDVQLEEPEVQEPEEVEPEAAEPESTPVPEEDDALYDENDELDVIARTVSEVSGEAEGEYLPEDGEVSGFEDEDLDAEEEEKPARRLKKPDFSALKKLHLPKLNFAKAKPEKEKTPGFFSKLLDLYMEPVTRTMRDEPVMDPLDPRYLRRKKREKKRIFKEVYLPAIIAGVALFLILSFVVGFTANLIRQKRLDNAAAKQESQAQAEAAERAEAELSTLMAEAERLAKGYDYEAAEALLTDFANRYPKFASQVDAKKAEYQQASHNLVEVRDTSSIANLSFHVLVADPSRAFSDPKLGGQYNKNFVTTGEFSKILDQLYSGNYVLIDYNSFVSKEEAMDGTTTLLPKELKLPVGKKPIMITETMVNYFEYMVDSNGDGEPDAKGHGFANKLVLDENGDIKAAIVDKDGVSHVGDYDLVPILEAFIKEHPDFAYKGARATLAVTGSEGVFGYRTNTSYVANKGQSFYDNEVAEAKKVVEALRAKGYTLASYTYNNVAYHGMSTIQIQAEMNNWTTQVTPVLGDVEVMVFARASDIDAYSGTSFNLLYSTGFRYFMNSGTSPRVDLNTSFVKQTRLMVTGEAMAHYSSTFSAYFDSNMVLDLSGRGSTPAKS